MEREQSHQSPDTGTGANGGIPSRGFNLITKRSGNMEPEIQQAVDYISTANTGLNIAHKFGLLGKIGSLLSSRKPEDQVDYREKAVNALLENAVATLEGIELTVSEASKILEPGFSLDDLGKLNLTWEKHWTEGVSKVGIEDNERRTWWARLLAGEIQQPGCYSLRTLAVMDTLSTKEAELFSKLCDYVWNPSNPTLILPSDQSPLWKPDFSESTMLENSRLAKFDPLVGFTWGTTSEDVEVPESQRPPPMVAMIFHNVGWVVSGLVGTPVTLRCGGLLLTDVGREMYKLTTPNYRQFYYDEIGEEWRKSYTVEKLVVASENP